MKKSRAKKRALADRRKGKGRKMRFDVHEKMVHFLAAAPVDAGGGGMT
jgi:hypothetical protein